MELTLQHLRMLREVAAKGTMAAAAESLGYTPSAVSQQLRGLEKATGVVVLEHLGRTVRLTDAGRELVRHADRVLAGMEAAQVAMERVGNEARGELDVAIFESVAGTLLPRLLTRLAHLYPDLHLRTLQLDPDLAIDALASGDLDLAFTVDYAHAPATPRQGIERLSVAEDSFHLVVAADDPISSGAIDLKEVADRSFITTPATMSCGRCVVKACHDAGFEPNLVHQIDDYRTTLHLVAAGEGVALVPDLGLVDPPLGIRVLDLTTPLARTIQLAYRTTSADRPAIAAVRDELRAVVADMALTPAA